MMVIDNGQLEEPMMSSFSKDLLNNNNKFGYEHYRASGSGRSADHKEQLKSKNKLYPDLCWIAHNKLASTGLTIEALDDTH